MNFKQKRVILIKKFTTIILLFALYAFVNTCVADSISHPKDLMLNGRTLNALYKGKLKLVKRGDFYGYGWLDDHRVFIAYQDTHTAEASVQGEVIDFEKSQVFKIGGIKDGHGDSKFTVNSHTREVVFNGWGEPSDVAGHLEDVIKLITFEAQSNSYQLKTIKRNINCKSIYWIDDNTIGAIPYGEHKSPVIITIPR